MERATVALHDPVQWSWERGSDSCYALRVFGREDQLVQFLQDASRFTVLAAVMEALVVVVVFVLASR